MPALLTLTAFTARGQTIVWDGGGDQTSWTSVNNWNPNRLPTASDDVLLPAGARSIVLRSGTHAVRSLVCERNLFITGGSLTISEGVSQSSTSTLRLSGGGALAWNTGRLSGSCVFGVGTLGVAGATVFTGPVSFEGAAVSGAGDITLGAGASWSDQAITGTGRLILPPGALLDVSAGVLDRYLGRSAEIGGTLRLEPYANIELSAPVDIAVAETGRIEQPVNEAQWGIWVGPEGGASRVLLDGVIDAPGLQPFNCNAVVVCGPRSRIRGGWYTRMVSAPPVLECPPGAFMQIHGPGASAPIFPQGCSIICPETGSFWTNVDGPLPEGLLDQVVGALHLYNSSTTATIELPTNLGVRSLSLEGGDFASFRIASDLTIPAFYAAALTRLELLGTLTPTSRFDGAGFVVGPGRLVIQDTLAAFTCRGIYGVQVENHARISCGDSRYFSLNAQGVFVNHPGAAITMSDAPFYSGIERGRFINRGEFSVGAIGTYSPQVYALVTNEPGGVIRLLPGNYSSMTFAGLVGPQHGEWLAPGAASLILGASPLVGPASLAPDCSLQAGGDLVFVSGDVTIEAGADVTASRLSVVGASTSVHLLEPPAVGAWAIAGVLDVPLDLVLPPTTIVAPGVLRGAGRLSLGAGMTLSCDGGLDGPGELVVASGARLAFIGPTVNPPVRTISRRIVNNGEVRLCSTTLRLTDAVLTNAASGLLRHGPESVQTARLEAAGTGAIVNEGTILCDASGPLEFRAPLDNRGTFISRGAFPVLTSCTQMQGATLAGGTWIIGGTVGPQWPAGTSIDDLGADADLTLEPGAALPTPAFDRTLRRLEGTLRLAPGRVLSLRPTAPARLVNEGTLDLAAGSRLDLTGVLEQTPAGRIIAAFAGPLVDQQGSVVADSAWLEGSLRVVAGATPCGASFEVVRAPGPVCRLSAVAGPDPGPGLRWRAAASETGVRAGVFAAEDFNADAFVDFFDYSDFVACFVDAVCPPDASADFNADGFADFFDYSDFVESFEAGGGC